MVAATSTIVADPSRTDELAWDIYSCWKEQMFDRFGCGSRAPSIPRSQRQYEGDNSFDYCEVIVLR